MATSLQIKEYLACWLQLGKSLTNCKGLPAIRLTQVLEGNHYSPQFERSWQTILAAGLDQWCLDGTNQTLAELAQTQWEIVDCSRCAMPVPILSVGVNDSPCPCFDLPQWPNTDLPTPRRLFTEQRGLDEIRQRLMELECRRMVSDTPPVLDVLKS